MKWQNDIWQKLVGWLEELRWQDWQSRYVNVYGKMCVPSALCGCDRTVAIAPLEFIRIFPPLSLYKSTMTCSSPGPALSSPLRSNVNIDQDRAGCVQQIPPVSGNICTSQQSSQDLQQQLAGTASQSEPPGHLCWPITAEDWLCNKGTKEFVPCQLVLFYPPANLWSGPATKDTIKTISREIME